MISIRPQDFGLDVALYNEFTLADFKSLEAALLDRFNSQAKPNVLIDMSEVVDFTIDMAVEELRFVRAHEKHFGRIAVVVKDNWIKLAAHIAGLLSGDTDVMYFDSAESAREWVEGGELPAA